MVTEQIANRVDILRQDKGVGISELSIAANISRSTLRRKLANGDDFTIRELSAISRHLGVPVTSWLSA